MRASCIGSSIFNLQLTGRAVLTSVICATLTACGGGTTRVEPEATESTREQTLEADSAPQTKTTWIKIADQTEYFQAVNSMPVRFGYGDKWIRRALTGNFRCDESTFGADPAPGAQKVCEFKPVAGRAGSAVLSWEHSADSAVIGYRIYFGAASNTYLQTAGNGLFSGSQRDFTIAGLPLGAKYYFTVSSIDAAGNESPLSDEVTKLVQ